MTDERKDFFEKVKAAEKDPTLCWDVVYHKIISSMIGREVKRYYGVAEPEDLIAEARCRIAESISKDGLSFDVPQKAVKFFNDKIRGIVHKAVVQSVGGSFKGTYSKDTVMNHEMLEFVLGPGKKFSEDRRELYGFLGGGNLRKSQVDSELFEPVLSFLSTYEDRIAAECFWLKMQGLGPLQISKLLKIKAKEVSRICLKFLSEVKFSMIENGERVTVTVMGAFIDSEGISLVVVRGTEVVARFKSMNMSLNAFMDTIKNIENLMRKNGVEQIVSNDFLPSEMGVALRLACSSSMILMERLDLGAIMQGLKPEVLSGIEMPDNERYAYLLARAKLMENSLKLEAYN